MHHHSRTGSSDASRTIDDDKLNNSMDWSRYTRWLLVFNGWLLSISESWNHSVTTGSQPQQGKPIPLSISRDTGNEGLEHSISFALLHVETDSVR